MPKYSSHLIFNFLCLIVLFLIYLQYQFMTLLEAGAFLFSYFLGTVILSPDLDTKSESSQRCGVVCVPYRKMSKHRGLSHHPIWGVCLRIAYFTALIVLILIVAGITSQQIGAAVPFMAAHSYELLALVAGLFVSNLLHLVLDKIS